MKRIKCHFEVKETRDGRHFIFAEPVNVDLPMSLSLWLRDDADIDSVQDLARALNRSVKDVDVN